MTKILMILDNAFRPDQRVLKEIETLVSLSNNIDLYCWDHDSELSEYENRDGYSIYRIKLKTAKQLGVSKIKYLLKFYSLLIKKLDEIETKYDYVYVHDFLMLPVGIFFKFKFKVKLIYDAHEIYHIMEWEKYNSFLRNVIFFTERMLIKFTDYFIVASEYRKQFYAKYTNKNIFVIGNWFDEHLGNNINLREKYNIPKNDIIIGYFGVINFKARPINKLLEKVKDKNNVHFFIGGVGADEDKIENLVKSYNNVHYLGWLENVREYVDSLDYVSYVMNNSRKYSEYTAPNTIYLAIAHQKPIITNVIGEPLEIIKRFNVGYFITDLEKDEIDFLENKENYQKMVDNINKIRNNYLWSNSQKVYKQIFNIN